MIKTWLIVDTASLASIQSINAEPGNASRQLTPVQLTDGRWVLSADLLTDCGSSDTWDDYATLLTGLTQSSFDISTLLPQLPNP
jgi:hypothetical protein